MALETFDEILSGFCDVLSALQGLEELATTQDDMDTLSYRLGTLVGLLATRQATLCSALSAYHEWHEKQGR